MHSIEFLVGTIIIRLIIYLTSQVSNVSVNLYRSVLLTPLNLSLICLIFLSTTVTASPAPVVSKIMTYARILERN